MIESHRLAPDPKIEYRMKVIAEVAKLLYPTWGTCGRCDLPWAIVEGHSTSYAEDRGCFPLCERCWQQLGVDDRLKYYRALWDFWQQDGKDGSDPTWEELEAAVLSEGQCVLVAR